MWWPAKTSSQRRYVNLQNGATMTLGGGRDGWQVWFQAPELSAIELDDWSPDGDPAVMHETEAVAAFDRFVQSLTDRP